MDNELAANFSSIATSNTGQEDQTFERVRGYSPVQERSASFGVSNIREPNAHESNAFGFGSMGGGAYDQEYSGSLSRVSIRHVAVLQCVGTHLFSSRRHLRGPLTLFSTIPTPILDSLSILVLAQYNIEDHTMRITQRQVLGMDPLTPRTVTRSCGPVGKM